MPNTPSETAATSESGLSSGAVKHNVLNGRILSEKYFELLEKREKLPCYEAKEALVKLVEEN